MPRKLPWLRDAPEPEPRTKRPRLQSSDPLDDLDAPVASTPRRKGKARATRTPSSSPPPQPPKQEFMQEGFTADDIWMMVEDEFLGTASMFTRHLHHAEYHRLKHQAREKNASAAQNVVRPVVSRGKMSVESQMKHEAKARAERQVDALRWLEGENKDVDELEEVPWAQDPHLGGLMSGSQDTSSQLAILASIKSKTRAAAGYAGTQSKLPPNRHDTPKSSKESGPGSLFAGLAKEIRRAETGSDGDLNALSSRKNAPRKESVRPSSGPSSKPASAREPSMLPPKLPRQSGTNSSLLIKLATPIPHSKSRIGVSSVSGGSTSKLGSCRDPPGAVAATSTSNPSRSAKRKPLTSRFTFFDSSSEPLDPPETTRASNPKKSRRGSPDQATRPGVRKEKEQKEKSVSVDEIPTFLL